MARGVALLVALCAADAGAQAPGGPDLNELALGWALGRYAAPIVCEIEGAPRRLLRSVLVLPGRRGARPAQARLQLQELEAPGASRCFLELGGEEPNVIGSLDVTLPGRSRRDTAQRDFGVTLRRERGFRFDVKQGALRIARVGAAAQQAREVDFTGGHAELRLVARGSDAERLLREFPPERRFSLELAAPDGTRLRFHLVRIGAR